MAPLIDNTEVVDYSENSIASYSEANNCPLHSRYPRRTISFSFVVQVREVMSIKDYSDEEIKNAWYSVMELKQVKAEAKAILNKIARCESEQDNEEWTSRGLEGRTREGNKEKFQHRRFSQSVVFMEQDQQEANGIHDPEFLADVYLERTMYSQFIAESNGSRDAKEAKDAYVYSKTSQIQIGGFVLNVQRSDRLNSSAA
jgi:hypothetical protein